ncbi:AAA family ATPase [Streptomyces longwoodensis]|uniref:AAA family ATPase n=1 Tax=Streptomyces longwoodensis TaxID=68231 RepID=UPI0033D443A4
MTNGPAASHGDPNQFSLSLTKVELASGDVIRLPKSGVTAIVGPNNSGKSTLLREITSHLNLGDHVAKQVDRTFITRRTDIELLGDEEDILSWILQHAKLSTEGGRKTLSRPGVSGISYGNIVERITSLWRGRERGLHELSQLFFFYGDAWQRIMGANPVEMRDNFDGAATSPLHTLQDDKGLFDELCRLSKEVFGQTLTLDRLSKQINLRVGETGLPSPRIDEVSYEYREALAKLPHLLDQGDGMKSMIGLLTPLVTSAYPIVFIDEPEAFLHPPQAISLGRILGEQAQSKGTQVVLATHDRNLIAGLLQSGADVSIVRLDRSKDDRTRAHQLNVEDLKQIWDDPVLRYSNVLDGLFHKLVVLAEAEGDCRFYASAVDEFEPRDALPILPSDILFVPGGGKDGLPRLARVLRSVNVPVVASPDLDILNNRDKIRTLVEAMGGDWSTVDPDYRRAVAEFSRPRENVRVSDILSALNGIFSSRQDELFSAAISQEFRAQLRSKDSPWNRLKEFGEIAFRQDPSSAQRLLSKLAESGVVAVRVGELERFAPQLGVSKGAAWLPAAIQAGAHRSEAVRAHVAALLAAGGAGL